MLIGATIIVQGDANNDTKVTKEEFIAAIDLFATDEYNSRMPLNNILYNNKYEIRKVNYSIKYLSLPNCLMLHLMLLIRIMMV